MLGAYLIVCQPSSNTSIILSNTIAITVGVSTLAEMGSVS